VCVCVQIWTGSGYESWAEGISAFHRKTIRGLISATVGPHVSLASLNILDLAALSELLPFNNLIRLSLEETSGFSYVIRIS
jgi:hypothetical protein